MWFLRSLYFEQFGNVFNCMYLDLTNGRGDFGSRFSQSTVLRFRIFSHLVLLRPPFAFSRYMIFSPHLPLSSHFQDGTYSCRFFGTVKNPLYSLRSLLSFYVALNPAQFAQLQHGQAVTPDPFSGRFGLRTDIIKSVERAHYTS